MKKLAEKFKQLHLNNNTFIMANAWNAGSAVLLEEAGFEAIGTTSAGIAYSHALPDYEGAVSLEMAIEEAGKIAQAVKIPVSMDAENGYGDTAGQIERNLKRIISARVVGANIEDYTGNKLKPLYDIELAADRIRAAKAAVAEIGYPFTLTARTDCFLSHQQNPLQAAIRRLNEYRASGADCLFAPGIRDIETIRTLIREVDGPVNVVMGLSGAPISLADLKSAGVARISIGGSLARATFGLVRQAAREMLQEGTFGFARLQIADQELCALFAPDDKRNSE